MWYQSERQWGVSSTCIRQHELFKIYLYKEMLEIESSDQDDIISDYEMEDSKDP